MDHLHLVLSEAVAGLRSSQDPDLIDGLARSLGDLYDEASASGRLGEFRASCQAHPLAGIVLMDPYARRAFEKPRGYAGDAVMLDYIYRPGSGKADGLGSVIHAATTTLPSAKSILWRRDYLAGLIHGRMCSSDSAHVLSVASGHMRELDTLQTLTQARNARFVALDQDAESIAEAKASYPGFAIDGRQASFTSLIKGRLRGERFDLIYSAGLFDYLQAPIATALIKAMFAHLSPGGMLSVGNFTRDSHGRGFMAGFMDWCLVYRDEVDLRALAEAACPGARMSIFRDEPGNVAYVEIHAS